MFSPTEKNHSPPFWATPIFGTQTRFTAPIDDSLILPASGKTRLQEIIGYFLYNARCINIPLYMALNNIGAEDSAPTEKAAEIIA